MVDFEPLASVECPVCGTSMVVSKMLGPYELIEAMGRGGMGVVYRAIDRQLDRQVALKVLRNDLSQDAEFIQKLDEEAAITGGIKHPHVVKVFTTGTSQGRFFIAMELVDRGTLDDLLELQGRVAEVQALEIASQIAQGLRAANQLGLIHRDVKPGNILFADNQNAKIVDFGLAILEEASKGTDEIWGTPYYVSPERLDRKPEDFRSDIYSLGATIFHAIAGRPPFEAEDATRVALKHLKSQAVSLQAFAPWVSGSTAFVINRMLNKDPNGRYESYDALIESLEYARSEMAGKSGPSVQKKRVVLETYEDKKLWGQVTLAVLVLVLVLGGSAAGYFLFWEPNHRESKAGVAVSKSVGVSGKFTAPYEAARKLLVEQKPQAAADAFQALTQDKNITQPLLQWCLIQESIGCLLAGDLPTAKAAMTRLSQQRYAAEDPAGRIQAEFFAKVAEQVLDAKPTDVDDAAAFETAAYGSVPFLLAGLKNWELGDFDASSAALRRFQSATPSEGFSWLREYQPLVEGHLSDLSTYRGATLVAKAAKTSLEMRKAAATLRKAKAELRPESKALAAKMETSAAEAIKQADKKDGKPASGGSGAPKLASPPR